MVNSPEPDESIEFDGMGVIKPTWGDPEERDLALVREAHRRFMKEAGDTRAAAALTLAWATLMSGTRASSR